MSGVHAAQRGIDIAVTTAGDSIVEVAIANHRPLGLASSLIGNAPDEALRRITQLFSICRIAQGIAGCMAVERALGLTVAPSHQAARQLLIKGETVVEHATCALLSWPALMGERPTELEALRLLRTSLGDLWRAVYPDGDWMHPGGGRLAPDKAAIQSKLIAATTALQQAGLSAQPNGRGLQDALVESGPTARLLRMLQEEALAGYGVSSMALLGPLEDNMLEQQLASDENGSYAARPELQGAPRETGPLSHRISEPLLQTVVSRHGRGLAARFLAQSIDSARCMEEMEALGAGICAVAPQGFVSGEGSGIGVVEAARGRLAHRVEIAEGCVQRYQIVAPTEWNFHPQGAFARGLTENRAAIPPERLAHLMIAALDPCVACQLTMNNHNTLP